MTTNTETAAEARKDLMQVVSFVIGNEEFGVEIARVREINRMTTLTSIPTAPDYLEGVTNLRGSVIPVMNLRKRLAMKTREHDGSTRVIVVETGGSTVGLIVDSVKEVLQIPRDSVVPSPSLDKAKAGYITAVAKLADRLVILLDIERVMRDDVSAAA